MKISRRLLITCPAAALAFPSPDIRRDVFLPSPAKGTAVMAYAFYMRPKGGDMTSIELRLTRSDTVDVAYLRTSSDNGASWSKPSELVTGERRPQGTWRRHPRSGFVDPGTGFYIEFWTEGVLPSDDPLEGLRNWQNFYRISKDGGRNFDPAQEILHKGAEYNSSHPLPDVWVGKNCAMLGDMTCVPIGARDGGILLPIQITPLSTGGQLYNPTGGYTYTDAAVLIGHWRKGSLEWEVSELIKGDPARSTRGMVEPTLEYLRDGRLLMILRGSNDRRPELPGRRWVSYSSDEGRRWTKPEVWTYDTGDAFFSPSACSQLLRHSSGRLFWIGNITRENPRGNRPRYPLVIGEVDRSTGLLARSSVKAIDSLQTGEDPVLSLSNFYVREDRMTKEIAVHATRLFAHASGWLGDAYLYRIPV